MARQSKLTPKLQALIVQCLRAGLHRKTAAARVRVDESTFSRWYTTGARDERGKYREFHDAVNEAEAQYEEDALAGLHASAPQHPKITMWLLSRRFPARYGRHDNVQETSAVTSAANSAALKELLLGRLERLATVSSEKAAAPEQTTEDAPDAG